MDRQDDSILEEFLVETHENLDQLERDLVALERDPTSTELVACILRAFHTIKGTSGFFGFARLQSLTHAAEGLLGRCRDSRVPVDGRMSALLFETVDDVRRLMSNIESRRHEGDVDVTARIEALRALQEAEPAVDATATAEARPPRLLDPLIASGRLSAEAADAAERQQQLGDTRRIGEILVDQGALHPDEVIDALVTREASSRLGTDSKVRVDVQVLDHLMNLASELVMTRNQVLQGIATQDLAALARPAQRLDRITALLQGEIMQARMRPVGQLWNMLPRLARDVATVSGKQVRLDLEGTDTELDRTVLEAIRDPLMHLVRNAICHGIETPDDRTGVGKSAEGRVRLGARHQGGQLIIEVSDDGAGIPVERIRRLALERQLVRRADVERMTDTDWLGMIFVRGLSTADTITALSGRGVGMDIVKTNIERIGGTVEVRSEVGRGTTFILRLPLTLAIVPALIVVQNGERYAIPRASIQELLQLRAGGALPLVEWVGRLPFHRLRHRMLSLIRLSDVLRAEDVAPTDVGELARATELQVVVVNAEGYAFGLVVDAILDAEEIVVKPLEDPFKNMPALAGATLLGDGRVALILDMSGIGRSLHMECDTTRSAELSPPVEALPHVRSSALLVQARGDWRIAVPCGAVTRLEEIALSAVQHARSGDVVQHRGRIMQLVELAALLEPHVPSEPPAAPRIPVLVVERDGKLLGFAVHAILDIIEEPPALEPARDRPGILGTSIIDGQVTDHLDPDAVLTLAGRRPEPVAVGNEREAT